MNDHLVRPHAESDEYRALVLKGPKGSGKSSLLAMLVHQCRTAGWLALYVPSGTSWISGWFYGKDEKSGFFDTPVQAEKALQVRGFIEFLGTSCVPMKQLFLKESLFPSGSRGFLENRAIGFTTFELAELSASHQTIAAYWLLIYDHSCRQVVFPLLRTELAAVLSSEPLMPHDVDVRVTNLREDLNTALMADFDDSCQLQTISIREAPALLQPTPLTRVFPDVTQALLAAHGDLLESLPIRVPLSAIGPVFGGTASVNLDTDELATGTPEEGNLKVIFTRCFRTYEI